MQIRKRQKALQNHKNQNYGKDKRLQNHHNENYGKDPPE